jgi:hypothetical protein
MKDAPRAECLSNLGPEDIRRWVEFNAEINKNPEAEIWLSRAFAFCKDQLGIAAEASRACSLVHACDDGETVGGVIVSSDKDVIACVTVGPDGELFLDHGITQSLQRIPPDHIVALLWEYESIALTRAAS